MRTFCGFLFTLSVLNFQSERALAFKFQTSATSAFFSESNHHKPLIISTSRIKILHPSRLKLFSFNPFRFSFVAPLRVDDVPLILEGIEAFRAQFGSVDIHYKYKIPKRDPWPKHLQGLELGRYVLFLLISWHCLDRSLNFYFIGVYHNYFHLKSFLKIIQNWWNN